MLVHGLWKFRFSDSIYSYHESIHIVLNIVICISVFCINIVLGFVWVWFFVLSGLGFFFPEVISSPCFYSSGLITGQ